jgi:hypothetical protein
MAKFRFACHFLGITYQHWLIESRPANGATLIRRYRDTRKKDSLRANMASETQFSVNLDTH